jgi:hypothetical protein
VRPTDWQFGASVQQEIFPRVSVEVGYFRRWAQNFYVQENTNVSAADYTAFSIAAPSDPRLPNGGGYTVSGLYSITPAAITRAPNNFITSADNYGGQKQMYNGLLVNVSARPRNGLTVQGGMNLGKTMLDMCAVRDQQPEATGVGGSGITPAVGLTNPYCLSDPGFITRVTGLASYTIPTVDVLVSTTFRSDQGAPLNANWAAPASLVEAALGRPLAGGGSTVTINLAAPGEVWGDRVNEIDIRIAKVLRLGRARTTIGLDIFNLVNSASVLTYNQNFSTALLSGAGSWLQPQSVLTPRFYKIGAQIDF